MMKKTIKKKDKIEALLSKMTLEEKVGQLRQCGPSLAGAFDVDTEELINMVFDGRLSKEKFQELMSTAKQDYHEDDLRKGKIGSYNGIADADTINRLQKIAIEETRLGIPLLFGYDVVHGYRTITPIPLAESCAWDPDLWEETGRVSAEEASAGGIHMTFAPMVDVSKDARWGRISECAGEDTLLNEKYGAAKVRGFQGECLEKPGTLAACVKHFAAYGAVESGRDYNQVDLSLQKLYEVYLPPYQACIKAGARAVMPAFNDINGVPCTANEWLLRKLLRNDWKFGGMTISDANAIAECVEHGIALNKKDAVAKAILAGVDMDMTSECYNEYLSDLVIEGVISEELLDQAVSHVLQLKMEMGLFEHPYRTNAEKEKKIILKPQFRSVARKAAQKSMVLLKNDSILPFQRDSRIAIVGDLADMRGEMTGTWAIKADEKDCISIIDACKARGVSYQFYSDEEILDSKSVDKLLENTDVILAAVGEKKSESGEAASRADLSLPVEQEKMLKKLKLTGKPIAVVLFNGRPIAIPWMQKEIPAILEAWHPGIEAGNAILDIVFAEVNPSGKLTTSFPQHSGQCPIYYDHIRTGRPAGVSKFTSKYLDVPVDPVYPFGFGLSYTSYEYRNMTVMQKEEKILVSVQVENTGGMDGTEIVQCYFHEQTAKRVRPVKKLVDFVKVPLKVGESRQILFEISKKKLGYYDENMNYLVDIGKYEFYVGANSQKCLKQEVYIK